MPRVNVAGMNVEALLDLQKRIEEMLSKHRVVIEEQLEWMDRASAVVSGERVARRGASSLKGKRVPPRADSTQI